MITTPQNYSLENFSEQDEFNNTILMILGIISFVVLGSFLAGCVRSCWKTDELKISNDPESTSNHVDSLSPDSTAPRLTSVKVLESSDNVTSPPDSTNNDNRKNIAPSNHQDTDSVSSFASLASSSSKNPSLKNSALFKENPGNHSDALKQVKLNEIKHL